MISKTRMRMLALGDFVQHVKVAAAILVAILAVSVGSSAFAADSFKGQRIYATNCAVCHGPTGRAVMPGAPNFYRGEGILKPDFTLLATIRSGKNAMPAFQGILSDRDIMDVIAYVRTLH